MSRSAVLASIIALAAGLPLATGQAPAPDAKASEPARLRVLLPPDAELFFDGTRTQQTGEIRRFVTPPLAPGRKYVYTLKALWKDQGKSIERKQAAHIMAGSDITLDFRPESAGDKEQKNDNVARAPDVPYVPTPFPVVDRMLELAEVKRGDVVYDLGCGDGRIVVEAAKKYGVKAFGFDIDSKRVEESLANVRKNKVEDLVTIEKRDIFDLDLSGASVVTLYLLPDVNVKLMPQLAKLKPGTRIVSHDFDMKGAKPKKIERLQAKSDSGVITNEHVIYLWVVPWERE